MSATTELLNDPVLGSQARAAIAKANAFMEDAEELLAVGALVEEVKNWEGKEKPSFAAFSDYSLCWSFSFWEATSLTDIARVVQALGQLRIFLKKTPLTIDGKLPSSFCNEYAVWREDGTFGETIARIYVRFALSLGEQQPGTCVKVKVGETFIPGHMEPQFEVRCK